MFSLKLLGGTVLEGPEGPLSGRVSQRRQLALLSVLALSPGRPVTRDKLLALLWPETGVERARHNLADSLYHLRKALGESAVLSAGEDLWLNPQVVESDVGQFEEAVKQGDLEGAVDLYVGPFLDGFHLRDGREFERLMDAERERLAREYARALEGLAEEAERAGELVAAARWWRRLSAVEPYSARITQRLMLSLEATGDRAGAIRQAHVHAGLLEREFGAEPSPDVTSLAERLRTAPMARLQPRAGPEGAGSRGEARAPDPGHEPFPARLGNDSASSTPDVETDGEPTPSRSALRRPALAGIAGLAGLLLWLAFSTPGGPLSTRDGSWSYRSRTGPAIPPAPTWASWPRTGSPGTCCGPVS